MMFINLIDFNNFIRDAATVGGITYPLPWNPVGWQTLNIGNDGLVMDPS